MDYNSTKLLTPFNDTNCLHFGSENNYVQTHTHFN